MLRQEDFKFKASLGVPGIQTGSCDENKISENKETNSTGKNGSNTNSLNTKNKIHSYYVYITTLCIEIFPAFFFFQVC